jgi:SAM-dependent methyltransferase
MPNRMAATSRRRTWNLLGAAVVTILLPGVWCARAQTIDTGHVFKPCVHTGQILDLAQYLASTGSTPDTYARVIKAAFDGSPSDAIKMTAFEENRSFVYAAGGMQSREGTTPRGGPAINRWVRRLIILNPSTFIVEDRFPEARSPGTMDGCLDSQTAPRVSGPTAFLSEASGEISAEILTGPKNSTYRVKRSGNGQKPQGYLLTPAPQDSSQGAWYLQVLHVGKSARPGEAIRSKLSMANTDWSLTVTTGGRIFRMTGTSGPDSSGAEGEISITTPDGKTLLADRPFPSGILPHGPEGNRLLDLWDSDYRGTVPALWDIGRPADELQKAVSGGKIGKCRVVDMCCGSGSDAIYLANKGFDVTAIDVAPTALAQAEKKAAKAHAHVHWVLADILAPPDLQPFDLIYDRGCYHVVRDQNLAAYLETVRHFSHPGTQFLLLAARRDEQSVGGPSGVSEEELRFDFLTLFDIEWLREIRLESNRAGLGPPGWSAFLRRNAAP